MVIIVRVKSRTTNFICLYITYIIQYVVKQVHLIIVQKIVTYF